MSDQPVDINPFKDRRRWWVALLMLFPTGAGYIYVGKPLRFAGFTVFVLLSILAWYMEVPSWVILAIVAAAIGFAADIIAIAVRQNSHNLRWPQRRKWYVAIMALWAALLFVPKFL